MKKTLTGRGLPVLIYNNDGMDLFQWSVGNSLRERPRKVDEKSDQDVICEPIQPITSMEEYLNVRLGPLKDSVAHGLSYNNVGKTAWELDKEHISVLGEDPLVPIIQWWKDGGRQFFFSMRMNDLHHGWMQHFWNDFRLKNPHLLLMPISENDWQAKYLPWLNGDAPNPMIREEICNHAFDYSHKEVREHYLDILSEACRRYDLDGVEFDWIRANRFFLEDQEKPELMIEFVKNAREILDEASKRVGHTIKLIHRVPDSIEKALETGLDVKKWIELGCVDAIISGIGEVFTANKTEQWVELCHRHNIPVYGVIERFDWGHSRTNWGTCETLRAAAATLWYKGVDGIYLFNHYIAEEYPQFDELCDADKLTNLSKEYFLDWDYHNDKWVMLPNNQYGGVGPLPIELTASSSKTANLIIADQPEKIKEVVFEFVWQKNSDFATPYISVNGNALENLTIESEDDRVTMRSTSVEATKLLRYGENEFKFNAISEMTLIALSVRVSHK